MSSGLCLIVDDEPAIRRFLRSVLLRRQLEIVEAGDAPTALRLLQKLDGDVDLLVSDIKMPGDMNGVDLAYSVRNTYPAIPVILMTGFCTEDSARMTEFCCLAKPFLPETILEAVDTALDPNHSNQLPNPATAVEIRSTRGRDPNQIGY